MKKVIGVLCFLLFTLCFFLPLGAMAEIRILALGDSLTEGYGVEPEEAYPYLLEQLLKEEGLEARVINGGFSGATSASAGTRLKWYFKMRPQIMLLALGANDGLRGLDIENMKQNLAKAIQMAQERQIKVVTGKDNVEAVATGLQRSARIITAAAVLLAVVFAAFITSGVTSIKSMGFGVALAVILDATIVRALLVPALMRLFGERNWWAPKWMQRFTITH